MKILNKVFVAMLVLFVGVSLSFGAGFEKVAKSRSAKVIITSDKALSTGSSEIFLEIYNKKELLKEDTAVKLKIFMPAMPGMPYMESKIDAVRIGDGKYKADINLAMSGTWQVHIFLIPKEGRKVRIKTTLNI